MLDRKKVNVAAYLLLEKDGKFLFLKRQNTGYRDGDYGMPSGHLEDGESLDECIIRETKEEIGIDVKDVEMMVVVHTHDDYLDFMFKATEWDGEIQNCEEEKCAEMKWFGLDELPDNITPEIKAGIETYLKGGHYVRI